MPRPRLIVLALAIASALTVAACGGDADEKNAYVDDINNVTSTLNSGLTEISTEAATVGSPEQAAGIFSDFAAQLDTAAAQIEDISPPDDVAGLHYQLVDEITTLSAAATGAADEIGAGGPAAVAGVATGFIGEANRLSAEVDTTISEINRQLQD